MTRNTGNDNDRKFATRLAFRRICNPPLKKRPNLFGFADL